MKKILSMLWELLIERRSSVSVSEVITKTGYDKGEKNMKITDLTVRLTPHLTIGEMTRTDNAALQEKNRIISDEVEEHLTATAVMMEDVRTLTGDKGISVHSAYRCPELNGDIPGASPTSQHPLGEACDFNVIGQPLQETFDILRKAIHEGRFWCGQLIHETRGSADWVHVSLGDPYRNIVKCGQVMLSPKAGEYILLEQIKKTV
jgi:uncharacterized protein YcbK (DUF882 family)